MRFLPYKYPYAQGCDLSRTYSNDTSHYCRFMIGHCLGRMVKYCKCCPNWWSNAKQLGAAFTIYLQYFTIRPIGSRPSWPTARNASASKQCTNGLSRRTAPFCPAVGLDQLPQRGSINTLYSLTLRRLLATASTTILPFARSSCLHPICMVLNI